MVTSNFHSGLASNQWGNVVTRSSRSQSQSMRFRRVPVECEYALVPERLGRSFEKKLYSQAARSLGFSRFTKATPHMDALR